MAKVQIGDRWVGDGEPCFVIAEAGINHNGNLEMAKRLVDASLEAGADAVKFQKRRLGQVYQEELLKDLSKGEQSLQYVVSILQEFELSDSDFVEIAEYCQNRGITFLCTPWDKDSADFLDSLCVPAFKVASADMVNFDLLEHLAGKGKPLLVSTGMSREVEIRKTIDFLKGLRAEFLLLHCNSTYPPPLEDINLRFMEKLRQWSGVPVGYSGHETTLAPCAAAVALGACVIERHITLDRRLRGPDHAASLVPEEFRRQVQDILDVQAAMGQPRRRLSQGEVANRRTLGKSLVATCDIQAGTPITREMVGSKGPGLGLSPQRLYDLVGRAANRAIVCDEPFREEDLSDSRIVKPRRVRFPRRWGVVTRFTDLRTLLEQEPQVAEIHLSDRDVEEGMRRFDRLCCPQELVVHLPEYLKQDFLLDLCNPDPELRRLSVERVQEGIDLARRVAPYFKGTPGAGPKVIVHVGGMSMGNGRYDVNQAVRILYDSLSILDCTGVEFLLENQAPHPWYFGGHWKNHILVNAEQTSEVCRETGFNLCFDTSHAMLACNLNGGSLEESIRQVLPYVRHLHVSDGAGRSQEGLQIGEGEIDFSQVLPLLLRANCTITPEIWQGHLRKGEGFWEAMARLSKFLPKEE
ncbi:MAG: N-acetylneuraminate synthase family protein [Nitrospinota bacterium]